MIITCRPENLLPIPKTLLDRLPGQAIRCALSGILPIDESEGWGNQAGDLFYNLSDRGERVFQATKIVKLSQV